MYYKTKEGIFMNAQKKNFFNKITMLAVVALLGGNMISPVSAVAQEAEAAATEIIYYDDFIYEDGPYQGQGTHTSVDYTINCDEMVVEDLAALPSAPSYGNNDSSMTNVCGPVAGTNIVVYYDRWATNLVPNFDPGMMFASGYYNYYPDIDWAQTNAVIASLYNLMRVPEVGGTTSANFKSGLNSYVTGQGYTISYTSCYASNTTLNLTTLKTAINAGKVALLMCSQYNFVYAVDDFTDDGYVYYTQFNSTVGHMMMVYGYKTLGYYSNGVKVGEDTFLLVSSGYNTQEQGYMRLNAFSVIDEAWITYIS